MNKFAIVESFHQGHCINAYEYFGAHCTFEEVDGVRFTLWAPHASRVQLLGDFNDFGQQQIWLEKISDQVFSIFVPQAKEGDHYRYCIEGRNGSWQHKSDPFAFYSELKPGTCSRVHDMTKFKWSDTRWMKQRGKNFDKKLNIYEVHAGAWKHEDGKPLSYSQLKETLIPYVKEMGFSHIEFMPLNEYPFDGSWGYQAHGYYSCTSRYGTPEEFMDFVNAAHLAKIGVIIDVVPVHFVKDHHGLAYFDGEPTFEYSASQDALSEWGTLNFDLWKEEVRSFLMSMVGFWCEKYHIDGIRMDAISNVIYWNGNKDRGVNEGGLAFVRRMNYYISSAYPQVMLIAEDSSDFEKVTHSTLDHGLGFDYKWDLGWMNDTLKYYSMDPIFRKFNHHSLTFSMAYYYSEKFLLPLSHDEVVHSKGTIVDKMWGNYDQKFAQARNLYTYMYTHPGKKLNFMGNELGVFREFDEAKENDWFMLDYPRHLAFHEFYKDLVEVYNKNDALCAKDYESASFQWIDADNIDQSIYSYIREDDKYLLVVVLNMTPVEYRDYKIGVPILGMYKEILNSDNGKYEGYHVINEKSQKAKVDPSHRFDYSIKVDIGQFAAMILRIKKPV